MRISAEIFLIIIFMYEKNSNHPRAGELDSPPRFLSLYRFDIKFNWWIFNSIWDDVRGGGEGRSFDKMEYELLLGKK